MAHLSTRLPPAGGALGAAASVAARARHWRRVRAGDVVLVKGSLGSRMAPIVAALSALGPGAARQA